MAPQTTNAWISAPQTASCLFFGPLHKFMPSKWMETESRARHVTLLAQKYHTPYTLKFPSFIWFYLWNFGSFTPTPLQVTRPELHTAQGLHPPNRRSRSALHIAQPHLSANHRHFQLFWLPSTKPECECEVLRRPSPRISIQICNDPHFYKKA
jgi:hypothetical protein